MCHASIAKRVLIVYNLSVNETCECKFLGRNYRFRVKETRRWADAHFFFAKQVLLIASVRTIVGCMFFGEMLCSCWN